MSVKIITDSTSYIPKELIEKYDITVVSLNVILGNNSYREVDLDNNFFYDEIKKLDSIPTSSQPNIEEVLKAFENKLVQGHHIVGIFLSSDMSGTYSSVNKVVKEMLLEEYPQAKIEIIDSRSNCMQMGYSVTEAAILAQQGGSFEEVINRAKGVINKSRFLFIPDTLEYLKKGGRIGGASALFGKILQIIPILTVEDGKTTVYEKVRTKQKAITKMLEKATQDIRENGLGGIMVHHINCEEEGKELTMKINQVLDTNTYIQSIGPVIGAHVGPGAIGIVYYTKEDLR